VLETQVNRQSAGSDDQRFSEAVNPANLLSENETSEAMDSVPEPTAYFDRADEVGIR
jgi:hypothetical protein